MAMPIFIVDPQGALIFYNEPAELILGVRFAECGEIQYQEWSTGLNPTDGDGIRVPPEELPLAVAAVALVERRPAHSSLRLQGQDSIIRHVEITALPIIDDAQRYLGAMVIFWEIGGEGRASRGE
jgi:hypothetical protein